MKNKNVLVAPLDWGLGHATRCIPVIRELILNDCVVSIATSGSAYTLLKSEFPSLQFFELPSYRANYSQRIPFMLNVLLQLPKFLKVIREERKETQKIVDECDVDIIISDNRYGCRSEEATSVFVGHQLHIIMPFWLKWLQPIVNYFNRQYIKKFDVNWIPDFENDGYAGKLSHPRLTNSKYVGVLSRFTPVTKSAEGFELAVILSGPEPQRTLLEKAVMTQLGRSGIMAIIVRGLPAATSLPMIPGIAVVNHLPAEKLQSVIANSSVILARSGYSTVMDLSRLGKKAIFIPTPGQTEQEYLAQALKKKAVAFCQKQNEFDLAKALKEVEGYKGFTNDDQHDNLLAGAIQQLIK